MSAASGGPRRRPSTRVVALGIAVVALVLAGFLSHYAASTPDGLTKVSQDEGFADAESDHATGDGPFAGYEAGFVGDDRVAGGLAGVVGVLVVLGVGSGLVLVLRRRPGAADDATASRAARPQGSGSA